MDTGMDERVVAFGANENSNELIAAIDNVYEQSPGDWGAVPQRTMVALAGSDNGASIGWCGQSLPTKTPLFAGSSLKLNELEALFDVGMKNAMSWVGADRPPNRRPAMKTLKSRSFISSVMSLLATVAAVILTLLPTILAPAG